MGISYDHTSVNDKHYFAGYLNLAEDNLKHIQSIYAARFGAGRIVESLKGSISEPDYIDRISFLKQYLPMLHYIDFSPGNDRFKESHNKILARRDYLIDNFELLTKTLEGLRHFYTHYYHPPLNLGENVFNLIDEMFLETVIDIKKQKKKNDHTRQLLKDSLKDEWSILFEKTKTALKEKKKENNRVQLDDETISNTVFNNAFGHLVYKSSDTGMEAPALYYKSNYQGFTADNGVEISIGGLLFLLGMFLSRKESNDLRSRVKGFKATVIKDQPDFPNDKNSSLKFMATHWVFTRLNIKQIRNKLNTGFSRETLLVQIVDELTKVPDEIYRNLSFEKQQQFVEDINEYIREGGHIDTLDNATVIHPVIRKRYENKFNYFVLRYLDEFVGFPSLRFQVHLGNYVHDVRAKKLAGTEYETERTIKEKINVFGRLSEVSSLKSDYLLTNVAKTERLGWEIFPNPSYNFENNNIPIFLNLQSSPVEGAKDLFSQLSKSRANVTKIQRNEGKPTKQQIVSLIDANVDKNKFKDIYVGAPTALLSMNEIPAMLYELLISKKTPKEIEDILIQKLIDRFNVIREYKPGVLPTSKITKKLNKSGSQKRVDVSKLVKAIGDEISQTDKKIIIIETNRLEVRDKTNKRKQVFTGKELGAEATWLANDLKRFMPKESRKDWKGYIHSQLQRSLAYYDQKPGEAFSILVSVWDFDNDNYVWNRGIRKAFNERYFDEFYLRYLDQRKIVLQLLRDNLDGFKVEKMLDKFIKQQHLDNLFPIRRYNIDSTADQINKILAKPLVFPRGIFDAKPTFIKGEKVTEKPDLFAAWYAYAYRDHPLQGFYGVERHYLDNLKSEKETDADFIKNKKELTVEKQLDLFRMKEDLAIKGIKTHDLFLRLAAEDIFHKVFGYSTELPLNSLYKTRKERLQVNKHARRQTTKSKGEVSGNIINDSFIWDKTISYHHEQLNDTTVKLKNVSKVRRFMEQEKVRQILSYDPGRTWSLQKLEDELYIKPSSYEAIRREKLLKEIQEFERYILQQNGFDGRNHPASLEDNNHPSFRHYLINGVLLKKRLISPADAEDLKNSETPDAKKADLLILIRNKFAHNQLPAKGCYEEICKLVGSSSLSVAETIFEGAKLVIEDLKAKN